MRVCLRSFQRLHAPRAVVIAPGTMQHSRSSALLSIQAEIATKMMLEKPNEPKASKRRQSWAPSSSWTAASEGLPLTYRSVAVNITRCW
jgi:hypothetical protein